MITNTANIQAKANIKKIEEGRITAKRAIDWEGIALRVGIGISFITIIGFLFSVIVFLFSIHNNFVDFSNKQMDRIIELTNKQAQLEGELEILIKGNKDNNQTTTKQLDNIKQPR